MFVTPSTLLTIIILGIPYDDIKIKEILYKTAFFQPLHEHYYYYYVCDFYF